MKKRHAAATRKPISYERLIATAEIINSVREGDPVAVVGGLAMQIWGSTRLTFDLDVVAEDNLEYDGEQLTIGGVRTTENGVPLDIIVRDDKWAHLYQAALDDAVEVDDVPLPVVTPEYLVAMKMIAGRPKDDEDLRFLVTSDELNLIEAEVIVNEYLGPYAVDDLRAIIKEAQWRKKEER